MSPVSPVFNTQVLVIINYLPKCFFYGWPQLELYLLQRKLYLKLIESSVKQSFNLGASSRKPNKALKK